MNDKIALIRDLTKDVKVLYVEDNAGLQKNMKKLLQKMFDNAENISIADDGDDGYKQYLKHKPKIVITDLNMPVVNGFTMLKKIKAVDPECKFLVLSGYYDVKYLHKALDLGVFRYLDKPIQLSKLLDAIYDTIVSINEAEDRRLFYNQLQNIFNYQNNLVVMMHKGKFVLPNQRFLEFFGIDTIDDFSNKFNIDEILLEHQEFLYTTDSNPWYKTAVENTGKLFHTKIKDSKDEHRHLILKARNMPEKDGHYVLSFDDVTELNLMGLYDSDSAKSDSLSQDKSAVLKLMQIVKDNASEVKVHNFYKGLTIVNPAVITEVTDESVTIKTVNSQLKIVQLAAFSILSSEIFPQYVACQSITKVDNEKQTIVIENLSFTQRTATDRKYIRLEGEPEQRCSLFYKRIKFPNETSLIDISEVSVKVGIDLLPAGVEIGDTFDFTVGLKVHNKQTSISTPATLFRVDERKRSYHLVLIFDLEQQKRTLLKEFIAERQMALIREFKRINIS